MNYKIFIEYDDIRLEDLSNKIYNLFQKNNYNVSLLNSNLSLENKLKQINQSSKAFLLSNRINPNNNIEIIYPLRSTDELASTISNDLSRFLDVSKYYQLRSSVNTAKDYYEILRDTNTKDAIIIRYGNNILDNSNLATYIYNSINNYLTNESIYIVKSGDSLYSIARRFNTTVDEIKRLNNLTSNNLSLNQKLIIPSNINENIDNSNNQNTNNIYTVKSGDSLYSIAKRFNTTVDEIKRLNNLSSNNLSLNQKLIIPSNINENTNNSNNQNTNNIYIVKSGDSLYSIARKFNTTVDEIKRLNNLSSNNLSINQKLIIK